MTDEDLGCKSSMVEKAKDFKELPFDSMHKRLNDFRKNFTRLKNASSQIKTNDQLK